MKSIILFEANEIPWRVFDDWCSHHPDSALARVCQQGRALRTMADDSELSPWITWPSLHRGVSDAEHGISDFGQDVSDVDEVFPPLWQITARNGVSTGTCGSFHSYPLPEDLSGYDFFIPDAFATGSEAWPPSVEAFQAFNLAMSRRSARNVSTSVPMSDAIDFVKGIPQLGLRPRTLLSVARQLVDERRTPWKKNRRRTYQVVLAFDVWMKQLKDHRPRFTTFFTNHVASAMHRYWAAKFPGDYEQNDYPSEWLQTYGGEIDFAMERLERMLSEVVAFIDRNPEYELWMASSMGQAATTAKQIDRQLYLGQFGTFMDALGFGREEWTERHAMAPRVIFEITSGQDRIDACEAALKRVRVTADRPMRTKHLGKGVFRIHPGTVQDTGSDDVFLDGKPVPAAQLGFEWHEIEDGANQSAYHIPEGALLVWSPAGEGRPIGGERPAISTLDVAPMILRELDVPAPDYMRAPPALS